MPQAARTFRIFVSSTFNGLAGELAFERTAPDEPVEAPDEQAARQAVRGADGTP